MNSFDKFDPFTADDSDYGNITSFAEGGSTSLEEQIRARWGSTGDWNQGGIDRVAEFASLLRANGISDINKVGLNTTQHTTPAGRQETESGYTEVPESTTSRNQLTYDGRNIGFLGDVNRDGSVSRVGEREYVGGYGLPEDTLGWSSTGKGAVSYKMVTDPDGQVQVVPQWDSSSDAGFARDAVKTAAILAAMTYGYGYGVEGGFGAAGTTAATTGTAATAATAATAGTTTLGLTSAQWAAVQAAAIKGAWTSAAANSLAQLRANGWDLDEVDGKLVVKSAATGAIVGSVASAVGAYNPGGAMGATGNTATAINQAIAGGVTTAATGGNTDEIWKSALAGGVQGSGVLNLTGNPAIDKALTSGVTAEIAGRDGWEAALASGIGSASDYAAGQTGIDPKLLRAVIPLAQGDPIRAARLLAQYGYDTYKPETVAYLRGLTDIGPVTDTPIDFSQFAGIEERAAALDDGGSQEPVTPLPDPLDSDSGYTADGGSQEPVTPPPVHPDPQGDYDASLDPQGDVDNPPDPTDIDGSTRTDVIPDQTDTPVILDTDLPPIDYTDPPPMPDIVIPNVVVKPPDPPPVKPTTPVTPTTQQKSDLSGLAELLKLLSKDKDDDSDSGYTAPLAQTNESPYGEIGRKGGTYG